MNKLLPLLIDRAGMARDRQAALARDAANAALQTQATLVRLEDFRGESLDRSPAALGSHADAQALGDYQRFVSRLDDAIAMQRQECLRREERSAAGQQRLIEEQRKLMAFETLLRRRAAAAGIKQGRRAQSDADEFAARAARNHPQGRSI